MYSTAEVKIPCAISVCSDVCPNGYAKDENGCETCVCKQDDPGNVEPVSFIKTTTQQDWL